MYPVEDYELRKFTRLKLFATRAFLPRIRKLYTVRPSSSQESKGRGKLKVFLRSRKQKSTPEKV